MHPQAFDPHSGEAPHWNDPARAPAGRATYDSLAVSGPDSATYLQSQLSQDLAGLAVGERCWSLLLEPAGKVIALVRVVRVGDDDYRLDVDAGYGEVVRERLMRFMIRMKITVSEVHHGDRPDSSATARRVVAGWPAVGAEIVPGESIPAQTGVIGVAVSFTKGCYPGQELVERMDSRGASAPRTLRRIDVATTAQPGDEVVDASGEVVGEVTSVAGSVALALIRRGAEIGDPIDHR
jgi:folate-binding protein YgfZ